MSAVADTAVKAAKKLPPWAIPVAIGGALGIATLLRKRASTDAAPVAAIAPTTPKAVGLSGADYGDVQGLLADQNRRNEERNAALQSAFQLGISDLAAKIPAPYVPAPALPGADDAPTFPDGGSGLPALPPPVTNPAPIVPVTSPVTGPATPLPAPAPILPIGVVAPAPAPAPSPAPAPVGSGAPTGQDWAALAYYLGGLGWSPGGLHYAGEPQHIVWTGPPYNSDSPPPPTGVYPTANLPVNFNGGHASWRGGFLTNPRSESAYIRTLRRTADHMASHPSANPMAVWDSALGGLMAEIGPIRGDNWYSTGFDLGGVRNSPFLDGEGTPNLAYRPLGTVAL